MATELLDKPRLCETLRLSLEAIVDAMASPTVSMAGVLDDLQEFERQYMKVKTELHSKIRAINTAKDIV
jgi:hypothetical protein